jgi:hypothetical protein
MNKSLFKKEFRWFGILIIAHVVSMIISLIFISNFVPEMAEETPEKAKTVILIFDIVMFALLSAIYSYTETSYIAYRKSVKEMLRDNSFSVIRHFKKDYLKAHLIEIGIFMVSQIPFVIFFAIWGFELQYPTAFEKFYIMDVGSFALTNSAILGWLLNTLLFGVVYTLFRILAIYLTKRSVEKDLS